MGVISKRKSDVKYLTRRLYPLNYLFSYFFIYWKKMKIIMHLKSLFCSINLF